MLEMPVYRVHHGDLVVQNHVRIIGHAVGYGILTLEQIHLMVVYACVKNILGDEHKPHPFCSMGVSGGEQPARKVHLWGTSK